MEIKDPSFLAKAKLEDILVQVLYGKYTGLVFHGGTAIWRCYSGNRFSRDLDFYLESGTPKKKMEYYREFSKFLQDSGFVMKEKGYSNSTDTMHFLVELDKTKMKVDVNFRYKKGKLVDYVKIDDSKIAVLSLSPLELLNEKIAAYNDKLDNGGRFKHPEAHDLYDMGYLVSLIKKPDQTTVEKLKALTGKMEKNPPSDIPSLAHLIIRGLPPSFELMVKKLREWIDDHS
jgi:predicted nucleotidyltransferase component of viral defense system